MSTKTIKTSEATGAALDWLVAKCENDELAAANIQYPSHAKHYPKVSPSTDWAQGGPIIERERIHLFPHPDGATWIGSLTGAAFHMDGPTSLIAAMRCFVASRLGEEVEVPDELA